MLLIGSLAAKLNGFDLGRKPRDIDIIGNFPEIQRFISKIPHLEAYPLSQNKYFARHKDGTIFEFEIAWPGTSAEIILKNNRSREYTILNGMAIEVATASELLLLKMSHRYLKDSPHFLKTMRDIQLLKKHNVELGTYVHALLRLREKETYTYLHPKLDVAKQDFFSGDGVKYLYDHDDIHKAMAHLELPAYEYYKAPGEEVKCSKDLFFAQLEEIRLFGVLEESYVLALERSQIPFKGLKSPRWSFEKALMKVCTSITSGWFREYAWENYDKVLYMYDETYVNRFWQAVAENKVRRI